MSIIQSSLMVASLILKSCKWSGAPCARRSIYRIDSLPLKTSASVVLLRETVAARATITANILTAKAAASTTEIGPIATACAALGFAKSTANSALGLTKPTTDTSVGLAKSCTSASVGFAEGRTSTSVGLAKAAANATLAFSVAGPHIGVNWPVGRSLNGAGCLKSTTAPIGHEQSCAQCKQQRNEQTKPAGIRRSTAVIGGTKRVLYRVDSRYRGTSVIPRSIVRRKGLIGPGQIGV
jgi:hypothetical protein